MKAVLLIGRIFFAAIFLLAAPDLFTKQAVQMAAQHNVPAPQVLVPVAGIIAILGGLSILLGYKSKVGAWLIIIFLVPVTFYMHNFWNLTDPAAAKMQQIMFMKNITMLGGALILAYFGTGPLSVGTHERKTAPSAADESAGKGPVVLKPSH